MRICMWVGATAGLLVYAALARLQGGEPDKADAKQIARLIMQLGDEKFARREAASQALAKVGQPALAALTRAVASSEDPEVRIRARRLVGLIEASLPFFNGKDLAGWRGLAGCWSVKDGALVGTTAPGGLKHNTFLYTRREFKDFELKFRVRLVGTNWAGNSGVQIRSQVIGAEKCIVKGPQADIGAGYWGCLYGELFGGMMKQAPPATARVVKEGKFNDYFIRCMGNRVTIKLNGITTVDDPFANLPGSGVIAFQLHGGKAMTVTFKDVEFKDLSGK